MDSIGINQIRLLFFTHKITQSRVINDRNKSVLRVNVKMYGSIIVPTKIKMNRQEIPFFEGIKRYKTIHKQIIAMVKTIWIIRPI